MTFRLPARYALLASPLLLNACTQSVVKIDGKCPGMPPIHIKLSTVESASITSSDDTQIEFKGDEAIISCRTSDEQPAAANPANSNGPTV